MVSARRPRWVLGPGAIGAGRDIRGPVTITLVSGVFERLKDAIFDPEPLRQELDLDHFTGRSWIIKQIDDYIVTHTRGYVVIQGEVGVGKSALAARLAFTRPCVHHFTSIEGARSPEQARRSLGAQLIGHWELHKLAPHDTFPAGADRPDWILKVIREAAAKRRKLRRRLPLVLVVDGLDDADPPRAGQDTGIPLGLPRPEHLPDGVFLVVTTRYGIPLSALRGPVGWHTITVDGADNLADMRQYLVDAVSGADPVLTAQLARHGVEPRWFIDEVADRCGGVWMYLRYVLDDIRAGRRSPASLDGLPDDLTGYYLEQLRRWSTSRPDWRSVGLPVLATLVAMRRPTSRTELARLAGVDPLAVEPWLEEILRPFLERGEDGPQLLYTVRHQSLRDLFGHANNGRWGSQEALHDALCHAHSRITDALTPPGRPGHRDWTGVDGYARTALAEHAAACGRLDELVCEPGFLLVSDPPAVLRHRSSVTTTQAQAAITAYELSLEDWSHAESDAQRISWLHMWARKARCTVLADRTKARHDQPWAVLAAMWAVVSHRTLTGHTRPVRAVCAIRLPDRTMLASAGGDRTVRLWDPLSGKQIGEPLTGHANWVNALCPVPLPDGRTLLASSGDDHTVRLWDPLSGKQIGEPLTGHTNWVNALCPVPLPDGRTLLASSGDDETVRLWDPLSGKEIGEPLTGHVDSVRAVCSVALPDGRTLLASAGDDETVRLWDPLSGKQIGEPLTGHTGTVRALCAVPMPGRALLASTGDDETVQLWDPLSGKPVGKPLTGHIDWVNALCAVPFGDRVLLASTGDDETVHLWDPSTGFLADNPLTGHTGCVRAVCAVTLPDGRTLIASAGDDETVRLWDRSNATPVGDPATGHKDWVNALCSVPLPDGRILIASAGDDQTARLWDPLTGKPAGEPIGGLDWVNALCSVRLPDRTLLATAGGEAVQLWDPLSGKQIGEPIKGRGDWVRAVCAIRVQNRTLLAFADDETVRLWDPLSGKHIGEALTGHLDWVNALCPVRLPGRTLLASAGDDYAICLWDPLSGKQIGDALTGHSNWVNALCPVRLPDRTLLASASDDETVRLWDPSTGRPVGEPLNGHYGGVRTICAVPLPEQTLLASAGEDQTVRLWDPLSGKQIGDPLTGHTGTVRAVCAVALPDGRRTLLASAGTDRAVLIWGLPQQETPHAASPRIRAATHAP